MSQADLSFNGFAEAFMEAAKRFRDFEERYQVNEAAFNRIQEQFEHISENAGQLESLTEERLAALSSLSVELKARHAQGEQTLAEVKELVESIKAQQVQYEQALAQAETRRQADSDQSAQQGQTLGVMEALIAQLQSRQSQLEQSLVAVETLVEENGHASVREGEWAEAKNLLDQLVERQAQAEKAVGLMQATQQAEKGLIAHFEKSINTVRSIAMDLEKRQAQADAAIAGLQSLETMRGVVQDVAERQAAVTELIEETRQAAGRAGNQIEELSAQLAKVEKLAGEALETAQSRPTGSVIAADAASLSPEQQQEVTTGFTQFLAHCEAEHKAFGEKTSKLQSQLRAAVEAVPSRADNALQKYLEQSTAKVDHMWSTWYQQRERRAAELESRYDAAVAGLMEAQQALEKQLAAANAQPEQMIPHRIIEALETTAQVQSSELRFLKTLVWITLAAVGLSYILLAYGVIIRSGT